MQTCDYDLMKRPNETTKMTAKTSLGAPVQLPFEVDEAVLKQVGEFLQEQGPMELVGPPATVSVTDSPAVWSAGVASWAITE
jgi:hypothetical protein